MESQLVKTNNQIAFTDDQVALIKKQIAPKATDDELKLFLYQAKRTGLDPLARQIYCIHRYDKNAGQKMTVQTSIDGFRVIAERSGDYGGQDEPEFTEVDGKPTVCKIRVYKFRGEQRYQAAVGVAYWEEYYPSTGQDYMWKKMPHTMLAKVAEALALRKAYPQDLSGLYTGDEMQQADNGQNGYTPSEPIPTQVTEDPRTVDELHKEYMELFNAYVVRTADPDAARPFHPDNWKKERTKVNYLKAIKALTTRISKLPIEA